MNGETTIILSLDKICRICLTEQSQYLSVFTKIESGMEEDNSSDICIFELLGEISDLKILDNDQLPTRICVDCALMASTCFKLRQQCNRSQDILQNYVDEILEIEVIDGEDSHESFDVDISKIQEVEDNNTSDHNFQVKSDDIGVEIGMEHEINDSTISNFVETEIIEREDEDSRVIVNANDSKVHVCEHCNKCYKFASSLRAHIKTHNDEKPFSCTICGKAFKQYYALACHLRGHSGAQPYQCKVCGKCYRQSGTLTAHMRVHTGQRPFLCSVCGRGFRQAPDLGYHMRTHTKEKPYMCSICGKTMSMQSHLVQHIRSHTGERPFKCTQCDKAFPSSTSLKRHAFIHTGLKPYVCEVCNKSFNRRNTLNVHSKVHTGERPYGCTFCPKRFMQPHSLKAHVATHCSTPYHLNGSSFC